MQSKRNKKRSKEISCYTEDTCHRAFKNILKCVTKNTIYIVKC